MLFLKSVKNHIYMCVCVCVCVKEEFGPQINQMLKKIRVQKTRK
jgi:hypothetical protein